jgi:hypothetical protein
MNIPATSKMRNIDKSRENRLIALSGKFSEFDEFNEFTAAWDIDFRPVGGGSLNATLSQLVGDSWSLAKARFDRTAYQRGVAVRG